MIYLLGVESPRSIQWPSRRWLRPFRMLIMMVLDFGWLQISNHLQKYPPERHRPTTAEGKGIKSAIIIIWENLHNNKGILFPEIDYYLYFLLLQGGDGWLLTGTYLWFHKYTIKCNRKRVIRKVENAFHPPWRSSYLRKWAFLLT